MKRDRNTACGSGEEECRNRVPNEKNNENGHPAIMGLHLEITQDKAKEEDDRKDVDREDNVKFPMRHLRIVGNVEEGNAFVKESAQGKDDEKQDPRKEIGLVASVFARHALKCFPDSHI